MIAQATLKRENAAKAVMAAILKSRYSEIDLGPAVKALDQATIEQDNAFAASSSYRKTLNELKEKKRKQRACRSEEVKKQRKFFNIS